jgi:hypothetical protein
MKLLLPIYKGREPVKIYKEDTLTLSFGTVEDIIDALKLDEIQSEKALGVSILKAIKQLRPFLKDIFDGITDDEIRHTHIDDIVKLFTVIFRYAADTLNGVTGGEKN